MMQQKDIIDRGYFVRENALIYYTQDMDTTLRWFMGVLGWDGRIIDRDAEGLGTYGFVADLPQALVAAGAAPFRGFHLWPGEPVKRTLTLIQVSSAAALHAYVTRRGWAQITAIHATGASPETCDVTTLEGSVLSFFASP